MKQHYVSKIAALILTLALTTQAAIPAFAAEQPLSEAAESSDSLIVNQEPAEDVLPEEGDDLIGDIIPPEEEPPAEPVPVKTGVGPFSVPAAYLEDYDAAFRVTGEHVVKSESNGGQYKGSALKYLYDGDTKTHWETGRANNDKFQNAVTFTFDAPVELSSVVYYPRTQGAANKGFPTAFSIYASQTESGEDFTLVCSGSAAIAAGGTQISFEPASFQRLRFVFEKAQQNWAAGGELAFYRPDPLVDQINELFTDGTMSALKPQYQDLELLEKMMESAASNPNKDLEKLVQTAIKIQSGSADYAKDVVTLEQRGNGVDHVRNVLQMSSYASNFLPTGYAARPGDVVKFYVEADENGPMPTVVFTQQIGRFGRWQRSYTLKNGENVITAPTIFSESWKTKTYPGGAIYFNNPYTSEQQPTAPRIRMEGGIDYPLFRDGDDVDVFLDELRAYQASVEADREHAVDIVEVYSDLFILNANLQAAAPFLNGTGDPQRTVDLHNARVGEMLSFAGVDESSFENSRNGARLNMRLMQPFGAAYAAGDHVGIQQGSANVFFKGDLVGWAYSHEIGHQMDIKGGKVPEVTNNMWANHIAVDVQNEYDRVQYGNIHLYLGRDDYQEIEFTPHNLGVWWQLHLLNENYWPDYQQAFRAGVAKDMGLTNHERMAVISSYVLGMDLIEHFERYGFIQRNEAIDNALAALNVPAAPENVKPWYLWTKATKDRVSAFTEEYTPEVVSVERSGENLQIMLQIDGSASDALLGFEVLEDGKVIGFTKDNVLTTTYFANDGAEHVYTARAYDLRMNRTEPSAPYAINLDAPVFQITGGTLTALYEEFDPLSVVSAHDKDGNSLTASIQVESNDVDPSVKGTYTVSYSVTDAAGLTSRLTVPVTVVSRFDYASDVQEQSATVGWGQFQKDKNVKGTTIKLLKDGAQVSFAKGLGVHASSEVVYDLTDTGYTWFESYIGIDQSMKNTAAKAKFQIYVDGKLRYDSGAMLPDTPMKHVAVDLAGAQELRLVTDRMGADSSDHTVWADARFAMGSSAPVIHVQDVAFTDPADVDLEEIVAVATVTDVEDGDLTDSLTYDTDYESGKTGVFTITYSVTDSDGNTTEAEQSLAVANGFVYVSDQDWKSARVGWGSIQRDLSLTGNPIKIATDEGVQTYEKGIGVHATSEIVYDLTGKDFYYFTSLVGVDNTAGSGRSSVIFRVYVDGELMAETPVMRKGMPAETLSVSLAGAKTLKLTVTDGGNGNGSDHANWADAKFLTAVPEADKDTLAEAVERANALDETQYTVESWEALTEALAAAEDVLSRPTASQEETDESFASLTGALDALELYLETAELEEIIELARSVATLENVSPINTKHQQAIVDNVLFAVAGAEEALADPDVTQEEIDHQFAIVRYYLWDMNPDLTPGWEPYPSR